MRAEEMPEDFAERLRRALAEKRKDRELQAARQAEEAAKRKEQLERLTQQMAEVTRPVLTEAANVFCETGYKAHVRDFLRASDSVSIPHLSLVIGDDHTPTAILSVSVVPFSDAVLLRAGVPGDVGPPGDAVPIGKLTATIVWSYVDKLQQRLS